MHQFVIVKDKAKSSFIAKEVIQVISGSIFLALMALFKLPLYPTPVTLQTLAVFILGLFLGSKKGAMACGLYLIEATLGAPVLSGGVSNPLWMIGCNMGFLISFPVTAFVVGGLVERLKSKNFFKVLGCVVCGQLCVDVLGVSGLSIFFGLQKALLLGSVPFVWGSIIKIVCATTLYGPLSFLKSKWSL